MMDYTLLAHCQADVAQRVERAHLQHGQTNQILTLSEWVTVLVEEVGELAKAVLDNDDSFARAQSMPDEMLDCACVAVGMLYWYRWHQTNSVNQGSLSNAT